MEAQHKNTLELYRDEMYAELAAILSYWTKNTCDNINGGFVGRIDENNIIHTDAPKGSVLNSRILWAFSSGYVLTKNEEHLHIARIAYHYLVSHFIDKKCGGVYWLLNADGTALDTKKQVYALAFAIYSCAAFFKGSNEQAAKDTAIQLYRAIEQHSYDKKYTGYLEAFSRDWKEIDDLRLSRKDANEKKTMNTHLHILEAYTSLYDIWPDEDLKKSTRLIIKNFLNHIINHSTNHLDLFFNEQWISKTNIVSYGHDIEAAWLIQEAAEVIKDAELILKTREMAIRLTIAAEEGLDEDGGLWYEKENGHLIKQKHWWPQAESMVGFFNAWQLTKDDRFLKLSLNNWQFVKNKIIDKVNGEWWWGIEETGEPMRGQDKVGVWKCPYHNARACMEIIKRINSLTSTEK